MSVSRLYENAKERLCELKKEINLTFIESENAKFYVRGSSKINNNLLHNIQNKKISEHGNAFIIEIVPTSEKRENETRSGCLSSGDFHDNTNSLNFPSVFPEFFFSP